MVTLTGVGIYIVIIYVVGLCGNLYYAGQGGVTHSPGVLLFGFAWGVVNLLLLLFFGFNV